MTYRKFKADLLFTGTDLLKNSVLITDTTGKIASIVSVEDAGEDVEISEGILSPGFINAHCHLELSHLKNKIPERTGLIDFVYKVVTERHFPEETILEAMKIAQDEMIQKGIVAVGDICNNVISALIKHNQEIQYYNFIEASGWNPQVASERFERSRIIYEKYFEKEKYASIVPHAPYSVSEDLWEKITPFFSGRIVTIHNQETIYEDEFFLKGKGELAKMYEMMKIDNAFYKPPGTGSVPSYFNKLLSASSVIMVHNTFIKQDDIDFINTTKSSDQLVSFCLCPNANMYIENTLPPVDLLLHNNVNIILGTDSLASNHQLSIMEEIKTISKNFPSIKIETLLSWATLNGATALQMNNMLGSFEPGKKPGIVLIENVEEGVINVSSTARRLL
ncbi:MAG: amidohydrolase family protein [Bacteroidota bacterium]|nr:amidohydrolase family protein [Bacteroidota bacterium]